MDRRIATFLMALVLVLGAMACDNNPSLERTVARERGLIRAEFFTENPENIQFPVKVLFAIDCSNSMNVSDPLGQPGAPFGQRIAAVRRFLDRYNTADYPNISFSIMLWSANVIAQTRDGFGNPGFTRSPTELNGVLDGMYNDTFTDYTGTLDAIRDTIHNDIIISQGDGSGVNNVARTKYVVCFFSDGMPNVPGEDPQTQHDIFTRVENMVTLAESQGVGSFKFHTFFLSTWFDLNPGYDAERDYAAAVLRGMALVGNGGYFQFDNAAGIDFIEYTDLRLTNAYRVKYVIAYNFMVLPGSDALHLDSDGDGLSDDDEIGLHATDPTNRDTDNDGLSDFIEVDIQSQMDDGTIWPDPLVDDSGCTQSSAGLWHDQDSDTLTDCEEWRKSTYRFVADYDADYIPDGIEMVARTNPLENIYSADSDMDGALDIFEVRNHTNANLSNDFIVRDRYSYVYVLEDHGNLDPHVYPDMPQGLRRYTVEIGNISLMDTVGAVGCPVFNGGHDLQAGDNIIRVYIAQVPEDTPNARPIFRMAEVTINTLLDDTYTVILGRDQFELID